MLPGGEKKKGFSLHPDVDCGVTRVDPSGSYDDVHEGIRCEDDLVVVMRSALVGVLSTGMLYCAVAGCGGDTGAVVSPATAAPTTTTTAVTVSEPTTTRVTVTTTEPVIARPPALFDFGAGATADGWNVVNDTVMGGVSSGQLTTDDGMLVFTGELSLDNNGGFASVRSPLIDPERASAWSRGEGLRLVVEGDGRTWTVEVRTGDPAGGWIADLATSADGTTEVALPWIEFRPVTRFLDRRDAGGPLDPREIVTVAFYLVDGIEAPFRLGIRAIS